MNIQSTALKVRSSKTSASCPSVGKWVTEDRELKLVPGPWVSSTLLSWNKYHDVGCSWHLTKLSLTRATEDFPANLSSCKASLGGTKCHLCTWMLMHDNSTSQLPAEGNVTGQRPPLQAEMVKPSSKDMFPSIQRPG